MILKPVVSLLKLSSTKIPLTSDIELDFKEIYYPTPPAYDHLLEILQDKFQDVAINGSMKEECSIPPQNDINSQTVSPPVESIQCQPKQQDNHILVYIYIFLRT